MSDPEFHRRMAERLRQQADAIEAEAKGHADSLRAVADQEDRKAKGESK